MCVKCLSSGGKSINITDSSLRKSSYLTRKQDLKKLHPVINNQKSLLKIVYPKMSPVLRLSLTARKLENLFEKRLRTEE